MQGSSTELGLRIRRFDGNSDLQLVADLIDVSSIKRRHRFDYPWRLSSSSAWSGQDAMLWHGVDDMLLGFAVWQQPWAVLDFYVRQTADQHEVEDAIFAWAASRFRQLDAERGKPLPYWAEAREDDPERLALLARQGFGLDDDYAYVLLSRMLTGERNAQLPPSGFVVRPIAGLDEVKAYVALHRRAFGSMSMTTEWRARTLSMPHYSPELDLVAVAPDGRLAGFCVCWPNFDQRVGQIEPLGVDPDFQGSGLGRALLNEICHRLERLGATEALVETETTRSPARQLYESNGFRAKDVSLRKGRWMRDS